MLSSDGENFYEVHLLNKGEPNLGTVIERHLSPDGEVLPCFWRSQFPRPKAVRADYVVMYQQVLLDTIE